MRGVEEGIRRIRDHFTNLQFEYEGVAGSGAFGMAFRVLDRTVEGRPRRLIVKKALGRQTASDVSREIGTLKVRMNCPPYDKKVARIYSSVAPNFRFPMYGGGTKGKKQKCGGKKKATD